MIYDGRDVLFNLNTEIDKIFNLILESGLFPTSWREGITVSLFKGWFNAYPSNYKGISLLT